MTAQEQNLCERCGFRYGINPVLDCHPGDCKIVPLPGLRSGRDQHGRYYPAAKAVEFRAHAAEHRARAASHTEQATELEMAADELTPLGLALFLPEVLIDQ